MMYCLSLAPTAPVRTPPVGAIAAGVTVGVLVLVGIAAVLAAGVVCYVVKRKEKNVYVYIFMSMFIYNIIP